MLVSDHNMAKKKKKGRSVGIKLFFGCVASLASVWKSDAPWVVCNTALSFSHFIYLFIRKKNHEKKFQRVGG
jgi:hypothetical protein